MRPRTEQTVLWRRLDRAGHEWCRLSSGGSSWTLSGSALFVHDDEPCRLDYRVECDGGFRTRRGLVSGSVGGRAVDVEIGVEDGKWRIGDVFCPDVDGAIDIDLNFSASTNLLPIRRLGLEVGEEARVRAAWLRFPGFTLEPLDQSYRRLGPSRYSYESATGFETEIAVDASGLPTTYPGLCEVEALEEKRNP